MKLDKKFYQDHFFKLERYRVSADKISANEKEINEAVLKIIVPYADAHNTDGSPRFEKKFLAENQPKDSKKFVALTATAGGKGTVDALDNALRKLLEPLYPFLRHVRLIRYNVENRQNHEGTGSEVEVFILASNKEGKLYFSKVPSVSVIEASFFALANIYNRYFSDYYMQKTSDVPATGRRA